jgi:hypothetical protein
MNKHTNDVHTNDVRPLSADTRYQGLVFEGTIKNAIRQAKNAPDYGLAPGPRVAGLSRDRIALLQHLNLLKTY